MKIKLLTLTIAGAFAFAACGPSAAPGGYAENYAPAATAALVAATQEVSASADGVSPTTVERLIIKNANLSLVVDNPLEAVNAITRLAEGAGGYVVSTNTYQTSYSGQQAVQAGMVVRVPGDKLTPVLEQLKQMAVEVKSENVSGQDVTADYVDLQSRLTNLEAKEKQLQSILEQTRNADDVLKVFDKLSETREQIEVIKGQMKYYKESAAFSVITLDLIPNVIAQPIQIGGWHPEGVVKDSLETLVRIWQGLVDLAIRFSIICGPFLLIGAIPVLLFVRWMRRNARRVAPMERDEKKV